ncbi:MAG TPA: hypothetical protein QF776_09280, partial [Acidimicrobiales bacterium]|nr:hypothetical protein [Acidimicrobiales bacterium]
MVLEGYNLPVGKFLNLLNVDWEGEREVSQFQPISELLLDASLGNDETQAEGKDTLGLSLNIKDVRICIHAF